MTVTEYVPRDVLVAWTNTSTDATIPAWISALVFASCIRGPGESIVTSRVMVPLNLLIPLRMTKKTPICPPVTVRSCRSRARVKSGGQSAGSKRFRIVRVRLAERVRGLHRPVTTTEYSPGSESHGAVIDRSEVAVAFPSRDIVLGVKTTMGPMGDTLARRDIDP